LRHVHGGRKDDIGGSNEASSFEFEGFPRQVQESQEKVKRKVQESRLSSLRYECIMNCYELELGMALNHES